MPVRLAVVCEAEADFRTATDLAVRVIRRHVDWVDDELLANCPLWYSFDAARPFLLWREIPARARDRGIRAHGHFGGEPAEPDAQATRRALLLLKLMGDVEGVLLIRDDNGDPRRKQGMEQARSESEFRDRVVIGLAHCKRESWVLAGFEAADQEEKGVLDALKQELGFDPCTSGHKLTAKSGRAKLSAKRVLATLIRGNSEREAACWRQTALETLSDRGTESGLNEYFAQVRDRIVPLFTGHSKA